MTTRKFYSLAIFMLFFGKVFAISVNIDQPVTHEDCSITVSGNISFTRKLPATAVTIDFISPSGQSQRLVTNAPLGPQGSYKWTGKINGQLLIPAGSSVKVTTNRQISSTAPLISCPLRVTMYPSGNCNTQSWSLSRSKISLMQSVQCSIDDQQAYSATKQYCQKQEMAWFNYSVSGTNYSSSELSIACYTPPTNGANVNADVNALANAMSSNYQLWRQISTAKTQSQVVDIAKENGYNITTADLGGRSGRRFKPQSSCGHTDESPCAHEECRTWSAYIFGASWLNASPRCQVIGHNCASGYYLDVDNGAEKCEPLTNITVTPLPNQLEIGENTFTGIVGYQAVIRNAEWAVFEVPNGKKISVDCQRLHTYVNTYACKNPNSSECKRLTPLSNNCSKSPPTCSKLSIKDTTNPPKALNTPLFTLEEWYAKSPNGLKINANWFDISGEPGAYFPHEYPCSKIYGYSVSNGTKISSASTGDPTPSGTNLLDALVITGKSSKKISIVPNADINDLQGVTQAVGGFIILQAGKPKKNKEISKSDKPNGTGSRTGVGIKKEADGSTTLYIVVIQGGDPQYTDGLNANAFARYFKQLGASDAINLDNSGSSQLVYGTSPSISTKTLPGDSYKGNSVYRPIPNYLGISVPQ